MVVSVKEKINEEPENGRTIKKSNAKSDLEKIIRRAEKALEATAALSAGYGGLAVAIASAPYKYQDVVQPLGSAILTNGTSIASSYPVCAYYASVCLPGGVDVITVTPTNIVNGLVTLQAQESDPSEVITQTLNIAANSAQKVHLIGNYLVRIGDVGANSVSVTIGRINSVPLPPDPAAIHAALSAAAASLEVAAISLIGAAVVYAVRKHKF